MSLAELESRQPEVLANMQDAREALGTIGSQITSLQTLPRQITSMSRALINAQPGDPHSPELRGQREQRRGKMKLQYRAVIAGTCNWPTCKGSGQPHQHAGSGGQAARSRSARLAHEEQNCQACGSRAAPSASGDTGEGRRADRRTGSPPGQPAVVAKSRRSTAELGQRLISATHQPQPALCTENLQAKAGWSAHPDERNLNEQVQMLREGNLLLSRILYPGSTQQLEAALHPGEEPGRAESPICNLAQFELEPATGSAVPEGPGIWTT